MIMQFWRSLAVGLIVLLGISYVGFAYIYSQVGGITIAGMVIGRKQSKVIALFRNSNITNLQSWNTSVDLSGYKTGFLYFQVIDLHPGGGLVPHCLFEVDEILGRDIGFWGPPVTSGGSYSWELNLEGSKMWIWFELEEYWIDAQLYVPESAVVSMSIYLRE